jgi:rod shape-determining protein MreD
MILGVNIGLCFVLAIVQTTLFPYLGITETFYDLPALFVLYLGLFRSARESLPVVVFLGFIVDSLSGGPFGVYLSIYFWLFLGVRGSTRFLHIGFNALLPFILAVGVLLQNGMELLILTVVVPDVGFPAIPPRSILLRMAWAFLSGPLVHLAFRYLHRKSDQWRFQLFSEKIV